jgi:hypothetical protein
LPAEIALNAARKAISVLPKPTSPQSKPIHDLWLFHIGFNLFERTMLIGESKDKGIRLRISLKFIIGREGKSGLFRPLAIKGNQTVSEFVDPFLDVGFLLGPIASRKMREPFGSRAFSTGVFADEAELL